MLGDEIAFRVTYALSFRLDATLICPSVSTTLVRKKNNNDFSFLILSKYIFRLYSSTVICIFIKKYRSRLLMRLRVHHDRPEMLGCQDKDLLDRQDDASLMWLPSFHVRKQVS